MTESEARLLTVTFGEGWQEQTEVGLPLIVIPKLCLPNGETARAIFVRAPMNSYPTRLFFDRVIAPTTSLTMHSHPFLGQVMYAHSIKDVSAALPPHEAILAHLRMYK